MGVRRVAVIGGAMVLTMAAAHEMYQVFAVNGLTALAVFMMLLFLALFAWIALSFTSALAGFVSLVAGGGRRLGTGGDGPLPRPATRTALLMPTYNESPARILAGLQAIDESLRDADATEAFDMFILSDTTDPDIWIAEEAGFLMLRERTGGAWAHLLPAAAEEYRAQVRQYRRMGAAVRRELSAVPDPRRRQPDDRRHVDAIGRRDGAASGCRTDPDACRSLRER